MRIKTITSRKLRSFYLDFLAIPCRFMSRKGNAEYHLRYICPRCPPYRKKHRAMNGDGLCWWEESWKKGEHHIPPNFGTANYMRSYLGIKTNMQKFNGIENKKDMRK